MCYWFVKGHIGIYGDGLYDCVFWLGFVNVLMLFIGDFSGLGDKLQ